MAAQVELNRDDYEKSIVRIFDHQKRAIGTGFLITPGYVLTCAHVVLQATDVDPDQYVAYESKPQDEITLDFPVLANGCEVKADVVAWLPYGISQGDVAVLRLKSCEPAGAKPIPLVQVALTDIEGEDHSVYGFGNEIGGRSDAYRPKANVAGGRFQFCKTDNPDDETIKPGFSGAPVWNEPRKCVIGMVATAAEGKSATTAYAIPKLGLNAVLQQVSAWCLNDVLDNSVEACDDEVEKRSLLIVIEKQLRACNPNGDLENDESDLSIKAQLIELATDRPPVPGWEDVDHLVWFSVRLALTIQTEEGITRQTFDALEHWVTKQGYDFAKLFVKAATNAKPQPTPVNRRLCEHLMVVIDQDGLSPKNVRVSIWPMDNRNTYTTSQPIELDKALALDELPVFLRERIRKRFGAKLTPVIHLFVPRTLFDQDVETQSASSLGITLGEYYPFVLRTNLNSHPFGFDYFEAWRDKWKGIETALNQKAQDVCKPVNCSNIDRKLIKTLKAMSAAVLEQCSDVAEFFDRVAEETALPVALWVRNTELQDSLTTVFGNDVLLERLLARIRDEREAAQELITDQNSEAKTLLGCNLSLVWEDPKVVPPNMQEYMQFDPEAC